MFAFDEMVQYMHGAEMGWSPCDIDLEELFKMVDLAESYDLPGLPDIILECARTSIIKKKKFIQIAQLTVNFNMHNKKTFKNKFILRSHIN